MEKIIYIKSITKSDPAVCETSDSFLQSTMWGLFKSHFDWNIHAFIINWDGFGEHSEGTKSVKNLLVLWRLIAPGLSCAYIPWGPELPAEFPVSERSFALKELACKLKLLLPVNTVFIRFDPPWFENELKPQTLIPGFKRAAADIQPPDTVLIDLSMSSDQILEAMKPKWRYNINLAEKRGVVVLETGLYGLDVFYKLLEETAKRDGLAIHDDDYYRILFEVCGFPVSNGPQSELRLYTAVHETDALAAIVVLFRGTQVTYLYGA